MNKEWVRREVKFEDIKVGDLIQYSYVVYGGRNVKNPRYSFINEVVAKSDVGDLVLKDTTSGGCSRVGKLGNTFYKGVPDGVEGPVEELKDEQPPLGVIPRRFWLEERLTDLKKAVKNYISTGQYSSFVVSWVEEIVLIERELKYEEPEQ